MKKLLKNPWILGIGTTIIGGVMASLAYDWIKGVDWLSTLKSVIKFIANSIISVLNFELKVWWVLVAIVLIFAILFIIAKIFDVKSENNLPPFLEYKKDSELGFTWEWDYEKSYDGKYSITNLHPVCSKCGMNLKESGPYRDAMECLRCGTLLEWKGSYLYDAQMLIEDNIKKKYLQNQEN